MNIVFMGSAEFGIPALDRVIAEGHRVLAVVTTPDRPRGRGRHEAASPIAVYAVAHGLGPLLKPVDLQSPDTAGTLKTLGADLFVVVAFRILPEALFTIPPLGTVNIHASLLPRYRGPAPIQRAIENGETETGVTVFRIDRGIDTGGILAQRRAPIGPEETTPQLYDRLSMLGAETLIEAIAGIAAGTINPVPQESVSASGAPKLRKEEGRIDWSQPAQRLHNRVRAFKPFPGTFTLVNGKRLGIEATGVEHGDGDAPGTVVDIDDQSFCVGCGEGRLRITSVRPEGKKSMTAGEYLRGAVVGKGVVLI